MRSQRRCIDGVHRNTLDVVEHLSVDRSDLRLDLKICSLSRDRDNKCPGSDEVPCVLGVKYRSEPAESAVLGATKQQFVQCRVVSVGTRCHQRSHRLGRGRRIVEQHRCDRASNEYKTASFETHVGYVDVTHEETSVRVEPRSSANSSAVG